MRTRRVVLAGLIALAALVPALAGPSHAEEALSSRKRWPVFSFDARPPYRIVAAEGQVKGFDAAVVQAVSKTLNQPVDMRFVPEKDVFNLISSGEAQAVIGVWPDKKYDRYLDYSQPVFINKTRLFVHQETVFVRTLKDLRGVKVGVNRGVDTADFLRLVPGVELVVEPGTEAALRDLLNRNITVYLGDEHE